VGKAGILPKRSPGRLTAQKGKDHFSLGGAVFQTTAEKENRGSKAKEESPGALFLTGGGGNLVKRGKANSFLRQTALWYEGKIKERCEKKKGPVSARKNTHFMWPGVASPQGRQSRYWVLRTGEKKKGGGRLSRGGNVQGGRGTMFAERMLRESDEQPAIGKAIRFSGTLNNNKRGG